MVRLNVAMVCLSEIRSALETADTESTKITRAGRKEESPRIPLEATLRKKETIPAYRRRNAVEGRTKRCLYLLARTSVAERWWTPCSAEEDVDDN